MNTSPQMMDGRNSDGWKPQLDRAKMKYKARKC
jgi:hypothetical protein